MRIEATLPDSRGAAALELADELGLTRSQLVDEALLFFMKAVLEVRRGRRVVTVDPSRTAPDCELASPTLTTIEWTAAAPTELKLSPEELSRIEELNREPSKPTDKLRAAAAEHQKWVARRRPAREPSDR